MDFKTFKKEQVMIGLLLSCFLIGYNLYAGLWEGCRTNVIFKITLARRCLFVLVVIAYIGIMGVPERFQPIYEKIVLVFTAFVVGSFFWYECYK
jgi:hypothetical protein